MDEMVDYIVHIIWPFTYINKHWMFSAWLNTVEKYMRPCAQSIHDHFVACLVSLERNEIEVSSDL